MRVGLHNWVTTDKSGASENVRSNNISKFLNRILGIPVQIQNYLFQYFTDTLAATISEAKRLGRYDYGIQDLGARGEEVKLESVQKYSLKHATGMAPIELHTVTVDRGLSWADAVAKLGDDANANEGFYVNYRSDAVSLVKYALGEKYQTFRPNTGLGGQLLTIVEIKRVSHKVTLQQAQYHWERQYSFSKDKCSHVFFKGSCASKAAGFACDYGLRQYTHNVLSGSVLSVWQKVEGVMARYTTKVRSLQVLRVKAGAVKIVGISIPKGCVRDLKDSLLQAEIAYADESDGDVEPLNEDGDSYDEY